MIILNIFKGNNGYTMITLLNWGVYNGKTSNGNGEVTAGKQRTDINNNGENGKNDFIPYKEVIGELN